MAENTQEVNEVDSAEETTEVVEQAKSVELSTKEVAILVGTDPKTLRRFIRQHVVANGGKVGEETPGRGGRYAFESSNVSAIKKQFAAWKVQRAEEAKQRAEERAAKAAEEAAEDLAEEDEIESEDEVLVTEDEISAA